LAGVAGFFEIANGIRASVRADLRAVINSALRHRSERQPSPEPQKAPVTRPIKGVSHALLRGCIVAVCLTYGTGGLFAWARSEAVGSIAQLDHSSVEDEPSAYALLWSYFSALVVSDSGAAMRD